MNRPIPFSAGATFRARRRLEVGDHRGAIDDLRVALGENPDDAVAHALLGQALLRLKRIAAARIEARRALAIDPELALGHMVEAQTLFLEGDLHGAERTAKRAARLAPDDAGVRRFLASTALANDRLVAASGWAAEAEALEPNAESRIVSARVALRRDPLDAERMARQAVALDPENGSAFALRAAAELAQGRAGDARVSALEALRLNPDDEEALETLLRARLRQSLLFGQWMRFAIWVSRRGRTRLILIFIGLLAAYRFTTAALSHFGHPELSLGVTLAYVAMMIVSWWSGFWLRNALSKERKAAELESDY